MLVHRKQRPNRPAAGMPGYDIRCMAHMIDAIDAMDPQPQTEEEKLAVVAEWRQRELALHDDPARGHAAANLISLREIDVILRTQKFRREAGATEKRGWAKSGQKRSGRIRRKSDLPADVVTITHDLFLRFNADFYQAHGIAEFRRVKVYFLVGAMKRGQRVMRIEFYPRAEGPGRRVDLSKTKRVRISEMAVVPGHYRVCKIDTSPLAFEANMDEKVGDVRTNSSPVHY